MTAMTATTLGTVMLVVGVLVLAWGFPNLRAAEPRRQLSGCSLYEAALLRQS